MATVLRSNLAELDLLEIWAFITEDSFGAADRFLDLLDKKCKALAGAPDIGRSRTDLTPGLRSFPVKRYVIFYRPTADRIEIARVLSSFRDVKRAFREA